VSWHPLTWIVLAAGAIAVPAALLLPDGSAAPVAAVERADAPAVPDLTDPPAATPGEPARLAPLEDLTETTARPLFAATRRPPPPEPVAEPEPAPVVEAVPEPAPPPVERTEFVLVGIVQQPDGPFVLLKPRVGGPVVTARQGDDAGGWHVETISPTAVRLTSPAGDAKHVLFAPRSAGDAANPGVPVQ
jgi:general secretion pathway protein N